MSILSSVTSLLELIGIPGSGVPRAESDAIKPGDDISNNGDKDDYSRHESGWKDARSDDDQPQKDYCDPRPSDDGSNGDTYRSPGEALARFDFSHGDFGSHGPDQSGDMLGALASMSSDDALEYAIGKMGPADHFDTGHFDVAADTSHDTDA
jgi:hypothetical protein